MTFLERNNLAPCTNLRRASAALLGIAFLGTSLNVLGQEDEADDQQIETIVVTAQKREQSILDVPFSISAVSQQEMEAAGVNSMADIFRRVPALSVIDQGAARKNVIIRGIQTETSTEASVNDVYLDEQRITTVIATADPRTFDMERVEILRGPQGTLFGGGSFAGTIRYISNRADVSEFGTNFAATLSSTAEAKQNYSLDGMVNIPLVEDRLAVRLVGYSAEDSGYLSNSSLGLEGVAGIEQYGARIGLRYTPSDRSTLDVKYVFQDLRQTGFPEARGVDYGDLEQGGVTLTEERLTSKFRMFDVTWNYDLPGVTMTSSTGYLQMDFLRRNDRSLPLIRRYFDNFDLTGPQGVAMAPPEIRLYINDDNDNYTFSQELRFASDLDEDDRFAWLVGMYYEDGEEDVKVGDFLLPGGGALLSGNGTMDNNALHMGSPADFFFKEDFITQLKQLAVFGEYTHYFTDRFNATIGYRHSIFESFFEAFALIGDEPDDDGNVLEDPFATDPFRETHNTVKFNMSYDLTDNMVAYFQSAEGFRLGFGSEVPPPLNPGCEVFVQDFLEANGLGGFLGPGGQLPGTKSDTLRVNEVGLKGALPDGRGRFSVGYFNGDWKDILVDVDIDDITGACNTGFGANAAAATTTGFEAEFNYAVTDQFTLSGSASIVDATIDNDEPFLGADAGERLPASPDRQLSVSGDYIWPMANGNLGFLRVDAQYIGELIGAFEFGDERTVSGNYGLANVRVGMQTDRYEWSVFADNITDNRALVFANGPANEFRRTIILQPRTLGLQFRSRF